MTVSLFSRDHKPTTGQTTKFEAQPRFRFFPCIAAASEQGPLYAPPLYSRKHVGRPGAASPSDDEADGSTCSPHPLHISLSRDPRLQQRLASSHTYSRSWESQRKQGPRFPAEKRMQGRRQNSGCPKWPGRTSCRFAPCSSCEQWPFTQSDSFQTKETAAN